MAILKSLFAGLAVCGMFAQNVAAKSVFAHIVMGNTFNYDPARWTNDITLAKNAGIDAFVLNCGHGDATIDKQVPIAFAAAEAAGSEFKLFFAFDYLGGGTPWPASEIVTFLNQYKGSPAYFNYNNAPFVSTFEGTLDDNIADWAPGGAIRSAVGDVYFVPDWASLSPSGIGAHLDNIEGIFPWDMWPTGATSMTDDIDFSWRQATPGKTYMMGVSPWFFHSPPKAWVWRGDDLWADRWAQTLDVQPEFVQIATWNDFGEAHYIGPIYEDGIAQGSADYVIGFPHESWRDFLPYYIATYKGDAFDISRDQMQYWYHTAPVAGGSTCGVVGNNADQGETEVSPNDIVQDAVFFSALLTSDAKVRVQIGNNQAVDYNGVAGINHWNQPFNGQTGVPVFSIVRDDQVVQSSSNTPEITSGTTLSNGCTNYNAWVGSF